MISHIVSRGHSPLTTVEVGRQIFEATEWLRMHGFGNEQSINVDEPQYHRTNFLERLMPLQVNTIVVPIGDEFLSRTEPPTVERIARFPVDALGLMTMRLAQLHYPVSADNQLSNVPSNGMISYTRFNQPRGGDSE